MAVLIPSKAKLSVPTSSPLLLLKQREDVGGFPALFAAVQECEQDKLYRPHKLYRHKRDGLVQELRLAGKAEPL
jgi:hypothetical protein